MIEKIKTMWETKKPLVIGIALGVISIPLAILYFAKRKNSSSSKGVKSVKPR